MTTVDSDGKPLAPIEIAIVIQHAIDHYALGNNGKLSDCDHVDAYAKNYNTLFVLGCTSADGATKISCAFLKNLNRTHSKFVQECLDGGGSVGPNGAVLAPKSESCCIK